MKSRTKARGIALQVLYEYDLTGHPVGVVLQNRFDDNSMDSGLKDFTQQIVLGVYPIIEKLRRVGLLSVI